MHNLWISELILKIQKGIEETRDILIGGLHLNSMYSSAPQRSAAHIPLLGSTSPGLLSRPCFSKCSRLIPQTDLQTCLFFHLFPACVASRTSKLPKAQSSKLTASFQRRTELGMNSRAFDKEVCFTAHLECFSIMLNMDDLHGQYRLSCWPLDTRDHLRDPQPWRRLYDLFMSLQAFQMDESYIVLLCSVMEIYIAISELPCLAQNPTFSLKVLAFDPQNCTIEGKFCSFATF